MAVGLLNKKYTTNYCVFSYDNWSTDKDKLPNLDTAGKDALSIIKSCSQGSLAIGTDGINYILTGNNVWIKYSTSSSGGSSGGGVVEDIEQITTEEIQSLF